MDANLKISAKGWLLVAIPLLAQALFLVFLMMARADQAEAQRWSIHSKEVLAQTQGAFAMAVEARTLVNGFVQTGDVALRVQYEKLSAEANLALAQLSKMVVDNPAQQIKAKELADQVKDLIASLDQAVKYYQQMEIDKAKQSVTGAEGFQRIAQLGKNTRTFLEEEEFLDQQRRQHLADVAAHQNWILGSGAVLAVVASIAVVYLFFRGIAHRLATVTENTRLLAQGQPMKPRLTGRDEICQLDHALHNLAEALSHKERENEMFVYSVSHDLRAPLVNLQGFSEELAVVCKDVRQLLAQETLSAEARSKGQNWLDHEAAEAIQYIQTAVSRLAAIIDALLQLSRVGRVEYHLQNVDVSRTVQRILQSMHDSIARRRVEVVVHALPAVQADSTALDQLFANLIGNAVNYLDPARPGKIEIGCMEDPVAGAPPLTRVYYVKDNGLGIPAEAQEKIFLAFQRLHPKAAPGEGIGLALVWRVVERHGGKVWVESDVGVGSTFYVALPEGPREANSQARKDVA